MLNSGRRGSRSPDGYGILSVNEQFNQSNYPIPIINSWYVLTGGIPAPDTALLPAGGETVIINGGGFYAGCSVVITKLPCVTNVVSDNPSIPIGIPGVKLATCTCADIK